MHSERPTPRMETERRAMNLLRSLVEKYLDGNGGQDWRFCMLAATIFLDISMKNETKGETQKLSETKSINQLRSVCKLRIESLHR